MAQPGLAWTLRVATPAGAPAEVPTLHVQVTNTLPTPAVAAWLRWTVAVQHLAALVPSLAGGVAQRGQRLRWRVWLGGEEVPAAVLAHPVRVSLDRAGLDTWEFGLRLKGRWPRSGPGAAGSFRPSLAADACGPLGTQSVDIALEVAVPGASGAAGGRRTYALITGGLAGQTEEDLVAGVQRVRGFGPLARYDALTLTASLAAGSHRPRGALVAGWLRAAGIPVADVPDATPVTSSVNVADVSELGFAAQFLRPALLRLGATPEGELRAYPTHQVPGTVRWRYGAGDLVADGALQLSAGHDQPTELVVTAQLYAGEPACGRVTKVTPRFLYGPYAPSSAHFHQFGGLPGAATLTPLVGGGGGLPRQRLTSAVIAERVERCGVVVEESVLTSGWRLRQVPRYQLRADGTIRDDSGDAEAGYLHNADAVWGDDSPLYATDREEYTAVQRVRRSFEYDAETGYLQRTVEEVDGWRARRGALRERPESSSVQGWDELPVLDGVRVWADGTRAVAEVWHGLPVGPLPQSGGAASGVRVLSSERDPVSREVVEVETDALGYTLRRTTRRYGWAPLPGSRYLYGDGETYGSPWEEFGLLETLVETYEPESESRHRAVRTRREERTGEVFVEDWQQDGHRPATARDLSVLGPDDAASSQGMQQAAEYRLSADLGGAEGLEACRIERQQVVDLAYAQGEADLERFARAELARLYGLRCRFVVPANPLLRKDDLVEVRYPSVPPLRVHLETVETQDGGEARPQVVTLCTGTVYAAPAEVGA